jgi:hypothetical protein
MTSPTHISFSLFTLAFASVGQGMEFNYENAIICALGSLSPDIDNSNHGSEGSSRLFQNPLKTNSATEP